MALNILIVDDSLFFQRVLSEIVNGHAELKVIGVANNGREAIEKVKSLKPDIVTMDYEMPMMDGVTAVKAIMAENPLPILMLSSMTFSGAKITIDALEAGAVDFMTKNFAEISGKGQAIKKRLYDTLLALGKSTLLSQQREKLHTISSPATRPTSTRIPEVKSTETRTTDTRTTDTNASARASTRTVSDATSTLATRTSNHVSSAVTPTVSRSIFASSEKPKIIVIGASTGGPAALSEVLKKLPKNFRFPILVVQHMPQNFTLAFSERLNGQCQVEVKEAEDGDRLMPGRVLVAPGGKQLIIDKSDINKVRVIESKQEMNYKPCIDISLASICNAYGSKTLAVILTGMGSDGCDGARLLNGKKATVWTQSEKSCVVYGMPMAIDKANLSTASIPLDKMAGHLCSI